ncbi:MULTISPECIES: amino acid ABC transporter permease [unclassified Chelatococcus]|uniref:amino acid ABC transporter permease n=1 Tax=unclassified Chelatococcus TaxID=2638111 RepID=UPI001BD01521|nr:MULTISPECIES: amino acid ABC transporter permease [unclassified Chelatococcus]MBS7700108.1 amino acid ABC transporter permease [Chelatococcus sp. YT9]MBX3556801.1 amino acid ABC transporter permease [Chelatococcus sp.]
MIRPFGFAEFTTILLATQFTLLLSLIALIGGGIGGMAVALLRTGSWGMGRRLAASYIVVFQGTPLLMQLALVFFGANVVGYDINVWLAAALGLTLHASAYLGGIWRGSIEAVPRGQVEASKALGLTYVTAMTYVVLPQAFKIALPPTVGFIVQLIKSTSVTALIGFVELTRTGQIINNATFRPFLVFGIVSCIYFTLCWPLSLLSARLERKLSPAVR